MNLVESFLTKNPCYTAGRKITVKGLMLHSVGCSQPNASVFVNSWNSASFDSACVHGFIDGNTGTIYQTLPWDHRGWHAGGAANNTHIGVEMCEPACIHYTGGASFTCSDLTTARAVATRTYKAAVELYAMLCKKFGLNPLTDIISHREGCKLGVASNHGDPEHLWTQLGMSYTMDTFRADVQKEMQGEVEPTKPTTGMQGTEFATMTDETVVAKIGPLFTADQKKSGILASVSAAQFILESGYGKSQLSREANNCFGMKKSLSGNTWTGSTWDGVSVLTIQTQEQNADGSYTTINADFRKYADVEASIADHSAYLLGAMNGSKKRYEGIAGMTDYKAVAQLLKDGGYATDLSYVSKLCSIIEKWKLTQFDVTTEAVAPELKEGYYRVRKSWADAKSQIGAYRIYANAKKAADSHPGYAVYDPNGKEVYTTAEKQEDTPKADCPFLVQVSIPDLNIRCGAGTNYARTGYFTGIGVFTIMEVKSGVGSNAGWGRLKSGAGWISLDYAKRL